jgi:hypothetical protein
MMIGDRTTFGVSSQNRIAPTQTPKHTWGHQDDTAIIAGRIL